MNYNFRKKSVFYYEVVLGSFFLLHPIYEMEVLTSTIFKLKILISTDLVSFYYCTKKHNLYESVGKLDFKHT